MVGQPAKLVTKLAKNQSSVVTKVMKDEPDKTRTHIKFLYGLAILSLGNYEPGL